MLKAFDAIQAEQMDNGIVDSALYAEERRLALDFVAQNPTQPPKAPCPCPVCDGQDTGPFMALEGVPYLRCGGCGSIFVPVEADTLARYKQHPPLAALRKEERYQASAADKRRRMWDDLVFWIRFRCARYLGAAEGLRVALHGSHHRGLSDAIQNSGLCQSYRLENSILNEGPASDEAQASPVDVLLYLDQLAREAHPVPVLAALAARIRPGGLLILSTRVGSGIDVLTLRGKIRNLFPYEHSLLATTKGLEILVERAGLELLEVQTPGTLDVKYLKDNLEALDEDNLYLKYLLETADNSTLAELQNFLQKSGTSSHARVIARRIHE